MAAPKKQASTGSDNEVAVAALRWSSIKVRIIGTTPLFQNRMANKAIHTLLVGGGKKSNAEKKEIKHNPPEEYRNSAEQVRGGPTALGLRVVAVKGAMATAALETPGLTKTSVQRLIFMPGDTVPLYGTPQLRMDIVRSADVAKTPDVRTRAYLPKWGAEIEIQYVIPQLSARSVVNMLTNAGIIVGVGDYRQEKGKGAYGCFRVIGSSDSDPEWDDLVANHGRPAQEVALAEPEYANDETAELMEFFHGEVRRRAA